MCGICGTVGFANQDLLKKMCRAMSHRGPDDEGYFMDKDVALGIRRLSVIDLDTGNQPIHNEDKTIWIVFNGEIYNFPELRKTLINKGHRFYTKSDTEVIVHLYEEKGQDCVQDVNGMFAFAIWDKPKGKLFIARDHLGVKPLYYCVNNGNLIFASELKSLLEYDAIKREVDLEAIDSFLTFLYIPAPLTIFKGINKLLPGHTLTYQNHNITLKEYWDLNIIKNNNRPEQFYTESINSLLKESVKIRLISDVPLGAFLSGGIDSSAVVGLMAKLSSQPIKTFTIGYSEKDESYNELEYARLVSRHFGTEHHEFIIEPDLINIIPKLVWHLDEPFADSSAVPTFLLSQVARQNITVALTGIGGDEGFTGYPRYLGMHLSKHYQRIPMFFRKTISNSLKQLPESTKSRNLAGWAKRFSRGGTLSPTDRYIDWVSFLKDDDRNKIYTQHMINSLSKTSAVKTHLDYLERVNTQDFLDKVFYLDVKTYLVDDLLFMADKMSMANSLELRVPFCDCRLLEFSASIPFALKIKGLNLKYLLKKSFADLLPNEILTRKKHGFMIPIGRWIKSELKDWTLDLLSEANIKRRGYFNYEYIRWMLKEHYQGRQNMDDRIWALLILEIWHQIFIDKKL